MSKGNQAWMEFWQIPAEPEVLRSIYGPVPQFGDHCCRKHDGGSNPSNVPFKMKKSVKNNAGIYYQKYTILQDSVIFNQVEACP